MLTVVVGAGIVGLHLANAFREEGHDVYVLDQAPYLAEHTSGRNSGVIHAGIFYANDPLKEELCIEGNILTYEWLKKLKVPHINCGKWIVPEEDQGGQLEPFFERIQKLPIPTPALKSASDVVKEEPLLRPSKAIFIPSTGVVDTAGYVRSLASYLEAGGVTVLTNCQVTNIKDHTLKTTRGDINFDLGINAAGLFCDEVGTQAGLKGYAIRACRGDYYLLYKSPLKRPVYHLPYLGASGLGVHLTPTFDGQMLVGPNAFFIEGKNDYRHQSDPSAFEKAVRYFLPSLTSFSLTPAYSGNRPKLYFENKPLPQFTIIKERNWIHLLGIESPGLTAAPAIAQRVNRIL